MSLDLSAKIESILFFRGEPLEIKELSKILNVKEKEISEGLEILKGKLGDRGVTLIQSGDFVSLGTHPEMSEMIENLVKEELSKDLGKAGLETLAIILYKGEASKREIDYIRGVNSGYILRNLLIRGLVNRSEKRGERGFVYGPTIELLSFMGIPDTKNLPEYEDMHVELENFLNKPQDEAVTEEKE